MLLDAYGLTAKNRREIIKWQWSVLGKSRKSASTFHIETNRAKYVISEDVYNATEVGDTIVVYRSPITNAKLKMGFIFKNKWSDWNICFARQTGGTVLIALFTICIGLFIKYYDRMRYQEGKRNLTFVIAFLMTLLFYLHIF